MEPKDADFAGHDPAEWEFHVRLNDGSWLARPEKDASQAASNAPSFTRLLSDTWAFDDAASARRAALSHGAADDAIRIVPAPRRPGEWLARSTPAGMARAAAARNAAPSG